MKNIRNILVLGLILIAGQPIAAHAQYAAGGGGPMGLFGASPVFAPVATPAPGQVLGAATSCDGAINSYMRLGYSRNNSEDVKKLQQFLGVPVTGFYGKLTAAAVSAFQIKYTDDVLKPWNISGPTGIMYMTTRHKINSMICGGEQAPMPVLVPWFGSTLF